MKNKISNNLAKLYGVNPYKGFLLWHLFINNMSLDHYNSISKTGYQIAHKCANKDCCNPDHLLIVDQSTNEIHKHFHYFLHHNDKNIVSAFINGSLKNEIIKLDLF